MDYQKFAVQGFLLFVVPLVMGVLGFLWSKWRESRNKRREEPIKFDEDARVQAEAGAVYKALCVKRLKSVETRLSKQVLAARPNMTPTKKLLYSNQETATLVYQVLTSNTTLPYPVGERICWAYFLVGNDQGFLHSDVYVESEACVIMGEIAENDDTVTIPQEGEKTIYFGYKLAVKDMVFKKSEFKPYPTE